MVGVPAYRRPVNMVFQHYALFPHMNVADNVGYGLRQARPKLDKAEIDKRVAETLELVRLPRMGARRTWELSGGQQQRVALARALVNRPTVLLLDEPLAALDRKLRRDMQIELQNLQRDVGITFILVTHDQEEALSMSDTIAIMRDGRIVQFGTPQQLYDAPVNRYVADFVGESNFLSGTVTAADAQGASVALANGLVLKARWSAAGEHLAVGEERARSRCGRRSSGCGRRAAASADLDLRRPGQVRNRIYLGDHTEFSVHVPELGDVMVRLPKSDPLAMRPAAGRRGGDRLARRAGAGAARHLNGIPGTRPATRPAARKNQDVVCAEEANMDRKDFINQLRRYQKGSISRRHFLGVTGLGTATAVLAASMPHLMTRRAYAAGELGDQVNLTTWPNYHDVTNFEKFTAETGVKVNITVFGSNEEMFAKLKAGGTGWDVLVPTNYTIETYVGEDMFEPLDAAMLPNYDPKSYTDPRFTEAGTVGGKLYAVHKDWGTTGFVINSAKVTEKPTSWKEFWDLTNGAHKRAHHGA